MNTLSKRLVLAALAGSTLVLATSSAQAQFRVIPSAQQMNPVNPYWQVSPGLSVNQWLSNQRATGAAVRAYPPWAFGYNPYPSPILNTGPVFNPGFNPTPGPGPFFGGANPYSPAAALTNPYSPAGAASFGGAGMNPYAPGMSSGWGGGWNPYGTYIDPFASALFGQAQVMQAFGTNMLNTEQMRIMREQSKQARLDTQKKAFDLELYIKANTPTFSEEQAKVAKNTLKRIQTQSNAAEIQSGRALNILLKDLRQFPNRKTSLEPIQLSEDILRQINVTQGIGNLGLLRNDGRFTWPPGLLEVVSSTEQKEIEVQTQRLMNQAINGKVDQNILRDLAGQLDRMSDKLARRVNDIPTSQYMEAKRFLSDFSDARVGLERGDAVPYFAFQKFVASGRSVQEVVDYLVANGLSIAPAILGEEAAYQALFSAMAAYDVAINTQLVSAASPPPKE